MNISSSKGLDDGYLTPQKIVKELNKYIIGQKDAKRHVAIALRNRWRRMQVKSSMQKEIVPNNILMIGKTGIGKTEVARRLAKIAYAPFVKVEASKFTEVGYVGRDVESMVRDLTEQAVVMIKEESKRDVLQKAEQAVEEILLNILVPPSKNKSEEEIENTTRTHFQKKLKNKDLDDRKIEISIEQQNMGSMGVIGGSIDEISVNNLQEMMSSMLPKQVRKRKVTVAEAKKIILDQEVHKLIDMDIVKEKAIKRVEEMGIIFIDEIDKIASSRKHGADVSREGVQRDLLPIIEGSAVNTKHGVVNSDHILFIAAGAFHVSKPSDLIPELQGRFPIRVELENLTEKDFFQILKTPKNALTKQYISLFEAENVELSFTDEALLKLASIAYEINIEVENIGARRLHTVMSYLLNDYLFNMPEIIKKSSKIVIEVETVESKIKDLVKNKDLNQYIL